jgi:hypothetical protein
MDVDTMEPGEDFVRAIEYAVGSCDVLIAVIGKLWLNSAVGEVRRLNDKRVNGCVRKTNNWRPCSGSTVLPK